MMRLCLLLGTLLLTGCASSRYSGRVDDPRLPIYQQEARGRERLSLPEHAPNLTPRTGITGDIFR